jgi:isopenicillin-N N-acyltransferase-like protein
MSTFEVIELVGDPKTRGHQLGTKRRDHIQACIDIYRLVIGWPDHELLEAGARSATVIEQFDPTIAAEIDAIASGAGVDRRWVHMLNARSELMAAAGDGCTAVFVPEHGVLGQTWDWLEPLEALAVVVRVVPDEGPSYATLTEPGIVAKIGANDAGIGTCLNFLYAPGPHRGVPVHVLLRAILGCADAEQVTEVIERAGAGRAANVLVATASGRGWNLGFAGEHREVTELDDQAIVRTNHLPGRPETAASLLDNSQARLNDASALAPGVTDVESLLALLADQSHPDHPICAAYQPLLGTSVGTVATVVADLCRHTLHLRRGPDPTQSPQVVPIGR